MTDKPKPDLTDDWMNPPTHSSFTYHEPQPGDPIEYLIERERRIICFGNPGSIKRWDFWSKYDTVEERDVAFARLREHHPRWHLRARDRDPYWDRIRARY